MSKVLSIMFGIIIGVSLCFGALYIIPILMEPSFLEELAYYRSSDVYRIYDEYSFEEAFENCDGELISVNRERLRLECDKSVLFHGYCIIGVDIDASVLWTVVYPLGEYSTNFIVYYWLVSKD